MSVLSTRFAHGPLRSRSGVGVAAAIELCDFFFFFPRPYFFLNSSFPFNPSFFPFFVSLFLSRFVVFVRSARSDWVEIAGNATLWNSGFYGGSLDWGRHEQAVTSEEEQRPENAFLIEAPLPS